MRSLILSLEEIEKEDLQNAGGKAVNLGQLARMEGLQVPDGFCISSEVFCSATATDPSIATAIEKLSLLKSDSLHEIRKLATTIRTLIENITLPVSIEEELDRRFSLSGEHRSYAVRSSATSEDLPTASFAGQHDTFLNVVGKQSVLKHVGKCWASLFTERAIIYRMQNGFDHAKVRLAVIVQIMLFPRASGIMFTADPVTFNRKIVSIDAGLGLGEALVSGIVNPDCFKVRNGIITDRTISSKKIAIYSAEEAGTRKEKVEKEEQDKPALSDIEVLQLAKTGRMIEEHFGNPQDIEWCVADGVIYLLQSRPITTLYPIPQTDDTENHVYVSVGHQQMMTDPIKPLGLSFFLLTTPAHMRPAGGRLFVDVTPMLTSVATRQTLVDTLGKSDPLIRDALENILDRDDFISSAPESATIAAAWADTMAAPAMPDRTPFTYKPEIVSDLIRRAESSLLLLKESIQSKSGIELFDFIMEDLRTAKLQLFDADNMAAIRASIDATFWINEHLKEWLNEKNPADILSQSVANNITSEMGMALLDVADAIRPYPEIVQYLQAVRDEDFLAGLARFGEGKIARDAIAGFLQKFGMRCAGEIDITKPRWIEKPATLLPLILGNIRNFEADASHRMFEEGLRQAREKEQELLDRLQLLPDGAEKARETKEKIGRLRNFAGYREYPKYGLINRYFIYKQSLLKEADRMIATGMIDKTEDIYFLSLDELRAVALGERPDYRMIEKRREDYRLYEKLTPPRVLTSDGEIVSAKYKQENLPAAAIAGLAVSSGVVEGRARVVLNLEAAELEKSDILVTKFTDPSWTPLFVSIRGLVTEAGGLMTHGSVIAREYGLPAVVGVENATRLIKDGQRIRVNGTDGYVEIMKTAIE